MNKNMEQQILVQNLKTLKEDFLEKIKKVNEDKHRHSFKHIYSLCITSNFEGWFLDYLKETHLNKKVFYDVSNISVNKVFKTKDAIYYWHPFNSEPRINWLNKRIEIESSKLK